MSLRAIVNKKGFLCFLGTFPGITIRTAKSKELQEWNHQLFSNFYLSGTLSTLEELPKNSHILYVGYLEGDMQIGITGSCLRGESFKDAATREIREEIGMSINPKYLKECSCKKLKGKDRYSTIYSLCIDDIDNIDNIDEKEENTDDNLDEKDDKRYKVVVIIYGSKEKINELIKSSKPFYDDERINYYASVPKEHALTVVSTIENSKKKRIMKEKKRKQSNLN